MASACSSSEQEKLQPYSCVCICVLHSSPGSCSSRWQVAPMQVYLEVLQESGTAPMLCTVSVVAISVFSRS